MSTFAYQLNCAVREPGVAGSHRFRAVVGQVEAPDAQAAAAAAFADAIKQLDADTGGGKDEGPTPREDRTADPAAADVSAEGEAA